MFSIEDLVYSYPDQFDPLIQTKITSKYEFLELASYSGEQPQPGKLFRHQELIKRLLLVYDRLLLFHGTGTGKTASSLGPAEYFKKIALGGIDDYVKSYLSTRQGHIRRVVVLTRGQSLIREIRNQLVYHINQEDYLPPDLPEDYIQANKRINSLIRQYYDIDTYGRFFSESCSRGNISDDDIVRIFSDYMFVIDEAHNLNIVSYEGWTEDIANISVVNKTYQKKLQIYYTLHRIFHTAKRVKVLLLTATPMIDKTYEIVSLMNLILPLDRQLTYDTITSGVSLEPYFRGLISYVKESKTDVNVQYQGYTLGDIYPDYYTGYNTVVYPVTMSQHQSYYYRMLYNSGSGTYRIPERQASNLVYPDGSYGKEGFSRYIVREGPDVYKPVDIDGFPDTISTYYGLYQLSAKFAEIIRLCRDNPGSCFVTSEFKEAGSYLLSVCFRAHGFEQYTGYGVFQSRRHQRGIALIRNESVIDPTFKPALRFALISPETPANIMKNILDLFNNYNNRHGEYVKVLIGSPIINIGINLRNVTQIHVVGPSWDQSITYQSISRAIRATSHVDLVAETGGPVDISIYQYASIDGPNSIDLEMYKVSEDKQRDIDSITDLMKSVAIDAQIHQQRNQVLPYYPPPDTIDYTSYDILYSNNIIDTIISHIQSLFSVNFKLTFDDIVGYIGSGMERYIVMALSVMLENKVYITNRYGYRCFLRSSGDVYYLVNDIDNTDAYYTENIVSYRPISIEQYLSTNIRPHDIHTIERLYSSPTVQDVVSTLDSIPLSVKALLLETAILRYITDTASEFDNIIIQVYNNYIFWFAEPTQEIEAYIELTTRKYVGRKRKYPQRKIQKLNRRQLEQLLRERQNRESTDNIVYVHTLYTLGYDRVSYAVTARFMKADSKIRLLKTGSTTWRDANDYELYVYNVLIQLEIYKRIEYYERFDIYGIYFQSSDKKFRIRDKTTEDPEEAKKDNRKLNRGRDCMTLKKSDIVVIMRNVGIPEPIDNVHIPSYDTMKSFLISQGFDEDKLKDVTIDDMKYYYRWMDIRYSRDYLCDTIREYMMSKNLVFTI